MALGGPTAAVLRGGLILKGFNLFPSFSMRQHFRIVGSARYLPETRISAEELDQRLGLPTGWTLRHTGVLYRHQATEPEDGISMARRVVLQALQDARIDLKAIDFLIDASLSLQQPIPCNAALIQQALGPDAAGIPCMDVHASCLGFVAALNVVNGLFASGAARRAVVVCAETPLRGVNWKEPDSACLMGDGAAAYVVEACEAREPFVFAMQTFGEGAQLCEVQGGGHRLPVYKYEESQRGRYAFHMEGKALHKLASRLLPGLVEHALAEARCTLDEIEVVPHQASGPAIEFISRRLGIPSERLHATVGQHGNLVAASIPFVLHGLREKRPAGTRVLLVGTAAGYTQAASIFTL